MTTHPAILPNCGTVWAEALRIPGAPTTTFHARSLDEVAKENHQKAQEARDRGKKKEWVYSEDVTKSMKQKFEEDRIMALGPGEDLRKKEEEELERRRSSAMDVDSETNTVEIGSTFEAPVNPAVPDRYRATIYYAGIVHTIHVSSIPWVLPGDPACLIHGRQHLFTPSLDPHKPNIPAPSIDNVHALFGEQRLPPTMKVGITAKISIPGDGHLAREVTNYERFLRSFAEHWSGYNLCYPLHDPTPCGAITPAFYGFYKKGCRSEEG
ncbi:hypothetical protein Moror_12053 [Moniliophthora roreri MCA 2997]|uniref:Uncharacterized protein n=1 Tax=Moniliophthora roreri (strain MCA 2997) TaxID=1381753 RepID=V2WTR5_MONRO|nr:hypothetical protein Moror_12053 [Moniliophthora roreri MCA 2997]